MGIVNREGVHERQKQFLSAINTAIEGALGKGESVKEITLYNSDLCLVVDLGSTAPSPLSFEDLAESRFSSLSDAILDVTEYDDLWTSITVDFGDIGYATNTKSDILESEFGRYFDALKYKLLNTGEEGQQTGVVGTQDIDGLGNIQEFVSLATVFLKDSYGENNFSITTSGDDVYISVWADGVAYGAYLAKEGDADMLALYQQMKEGSQKAAESWYETLKTIVPEGHIEFDVVNDLEKTSVLLGFIDGICYFDALS